jgi:hypothetical protein
MAWWGALVVVEAEVVRERGFCFPAILIRFEIHLLGFHRAPRPFDEQIVVVAPFAVHADADIVSLQLRRSQTLA